MEPLVIIILFIVAAIIFRLIAGSMDSGRIAEYISSQGGSLLTKSWSPFGNGWYGEKNARIYEITYKDKVGNIRSATVKTSLLSGVYLTQDRITKAISKPKDQIIPPTEEQSLKSENEKLKARISQLEKMQSKST